MSQTDTTVSPLDACDPSLNATVSASAGSGKTWLLITRIVRLLIDGAEPGNIIALTFTRKAAGEMQVRLNQRLLEMATADEDQLDELLRMIGCEVNQLNRSIARNLYEKLINSLYPIRIQTFHSFCQDILSRFPLEADIPPGFELIEDSSLLERQAWRMLFDEAGHSSSTGSRRLNDELDIIMQACNGPDNTHKALQSFLMHRSDWWAYTDHHTDPVSYASSQLAQQLAIDADSESDPVTDFLNDITRQKLKIFVGLLREIKLKTSNQHADLIETALKQSTDDGDAIFTLLRSAFLTQKGVPLSQGRSYTPTLEKKLGADNAQRFVDLHEEIADHICEAEDTRKRYSAHTLNSAWFYAGQRYLDIFQQLKTELRQLDFTDLEWKCYQLLQQSDNAHWVQYKIDQRIDHLLIDEFQDTNPTQWQLLSPILEEIAANPEERPRSVFLVGDEKQSIYSFRRANPELQAQASRWLQEHLGAIASPLDFSRRSSNAIIHCVNLIFEQDEIKKIMTGYTSHDTHLKKLPGKVHLCDLFELDDTDAKDGTDIESSQPGFRNPLLQPRIIEQKTPRTDEADYIARRIAHMVRQGEPITYDGKVRPIEHGDILILVRNRTHLKTYEDALKRLAIPFIGNSKGGLLDNLEIKDFSCLLNTLITPYDNLSFAQILKSPIFDASDDDLVMLARQEGISPHWYERLLFMTNPSADDKEYALSEQLRRAAELLPHWQKLAEQLPVHDCLDRIFSEGNIIARYMSASKPENRQRVASNCQRFLELSLEVDSGRYPSITRFLQRLSHLQQHSQNPPEEPLSPGNASRVRIMTIHGSKGLESPVVFLADCNSTASNNNAYSGLVNWPADKTRPAHFQLQLSSDKTDDSTRKLQEKKLKEQEREELNLLYVALTRAREQLHISGVTSRKKSGNSWYQIISDGLQELDNCTLDLAHDNSESDKAITCRTFSHLAYEMHESAGIKNDTGDALIKDDIAESEAELLERLHRPINLPKRNLTATDRVIAPSHQHDPQSDQNIAQQEVVDAELATWRGTMIHRILEQLCICGEYPADSNHIHGFLQQLHTETNAHRPEFIDKLDECIDEALSTYNHPELVAIFNPAEETECHNELQLIYTRGDSTVHGILDRVIRSDNEVMVIDYKSHRFGDRCSLEEEANRFSEQLAYYSDGVKKMWPGRSVKTGVLLTNYRQVIWL